MGLLVFGSRYLHDNYVTQRSISHGIQFKVRLFNLILVYIDQ